MTVATARITSDNRSFNRICQEMLVCTSMKYMVLGLAILTPPKAQMVYQCSDRCDQHTKTPTTLH